MGSRSEILIQLDISKNKIMLALSVTRRGYPTHNLFFAYNSSLHSTAKHKCCYLLSSTSSPKSWNSCKQDYNYWPRWAFKVAVCVERSNMRVAVSAIGFSSHFIEGLSSIVTIPSPRSAQGDRAMSLYWLPKGQRLNEFPIQHYGGVEIELTALKWTGGPYTSNAVVPEDSFRIVTGDTTELIPSLYSRITDRTVQVNRSFVISLEIRARTTVTFSVPIVAQVYSQRSRSCQAWLR